MSPFVAGMKVVCKTDGHAWGKQTGLAIVPQPGEIVPQHGEIYTVRTVECVIGEIWLRLVEIVNRPLAVGGYEIQFEARAFRPLTDRETTIEALKRITPDTPIPSTLDPNPRRVPAKVVS